MRMEKGQVVRMKDDRPRLIIAAVIMGIVIVGVSVLSVRSASGRGGMQREGFAFWGSFALGGRARLRNTIEIPLTQAECLTLRYGSKNITVHPSKEETIVIEEYLYGKNQKALATVSYGDDKEVTVEGGEQTYVMFGALFSGGEKIEVYLPERSLRKFSVETKSGNITSRADCVREEGVLAVKAGSGNIRWENTAGGELSFESGSGNITAEKIRGNMTFQLGSGNLRLEGLSGSARAAVGSGNINAVFDEVAESAELQSGSGNIKLELPRELKFRFQADTGSGNIQTDFDGSLSFNRKGNSASGDVGEDPACRVKTETHSGNISVRYR